jgi:hypothetical protein
VDAGVRLCVALYEGHSFWDHVPAPAFDIPHFFVLLGADTPWTGKAASLDMVEKQRMFNVPCYTDDPSTSLLSIPDSVLSATQAPFLSVVAVPNAFLRVVNYPTRLTPRKLVTFLLLLFKNLLTLS